MSSGCRHSLTMKFNVLFRLSLTLLLPLLSRTENAGTCFLSPFQLPSPSSIPQSPPAAASPPNNLQSEFRTSFAFNQLSPIDGNALTSAFRTSAHGNAPQVPPGVIGKPPDVLTRGRPTSQVKETSSQVKENTDRNFGGDGFLFPGEKPDRPSPTQPPSDRNLFPPTTKGGTDNRFVFPGEVPASTPAPITTPAGTKGGHTTDSRFVFPGEGSLPHFGTTAPPPAPVLQQKERAIIRRPASRIFGSKGSFAEGHIFFSPPPQVINREELEAIAQFESALEEAKREGLYGLRTRSRPRTPLVPPPRPQLPRLPTRVNAYVSTKSYHHSGPREQVHDLGFFDLGVKDFRESFGIDPVAAGLITDRGIGHSGSRSRQAKQLFGSNSNDNAADNDDDGFSPRLPPPPPLSQILPPVQSAPLYAPAIFTPGRFYEWLERSSFLNNMRIAPETNFTVLLPTDEAINFLPPAFVSEITENATRLREILFYHIIPESIGVETIESEDMIPTLLRKKDIRVTKGSTTDLLMMSGARVLGERQDLSLENGKVRFIQIDRVLVPPRGTLYEVISAAPGLSIFKGLVDNTGLRSELERDANSGLSGLTLFVPTDTAFAQVNNEAASILTRDAAVARSFLLNHFAKAVIFASAIPAGGSVTAKNLGSEQDLRIERPSRDLVRVNDVTISFADVLATNGVLHVIDHVLL